MHSPAIFSNYHTYLARCKTACGFGPYLATTDAPVSARCHLAAASTGRSLSAALIMLSPNSLHCAHNSKFLSRFDRSRLKVPEKTWSRHLFSSGDDVCIAWPTAKTTHCSCWSSCLHVANVDVDALILHHIISMDICLYVQRDEC
jgi:hypothetical protein